MQGVAVTGAADRAARSVEVVSIVVCTAGRRPTLRPLLHDLVNLDDPAFEVVVVENTRRPTLDASALADLGVRHVVERRVGLDVARNRGAMEAAGTIVAYVDDDCTVDPEWLAGIRRGFADPEVSLVTGRVLPTTLHLESQRLFQHWCPWDRGVVPSRFTRDDTRPWFPAAVHHLGTGCNMAFRRSSLLAIGGFDEALDMGSLVAGGGDIDMFSRVLDAGLVAHYEPTAIIRHTHRETMRDLRWQVWGYGVAQGAVFAKGLATRRGLRAAVIGFWRFRLATKWAELRRAGVGAVPRRLIVLEAVGIVVGPAVYPASKLVTWWRRRRS